MKKLKDVIMNAPFLIRCSMTVTLSFVCVMIALFPAATLFFIGCLALIVCIIATAVYLIQEFI